MKPPSVTAGSPDSHYRMAAQSQSQSESEGPPRLGFLMEGPDPTTTTTPSAAGTPMPPSGPSRRERTTVPPRSSPRRPPRTLAPGKTLSHGSVSLLGRRRDMEDTVTEVTGFSAGGYG
ncbi:unnamed protein product [Musa acuminata subsp. burmannicoides]